MPYLIVWVLNLRASQHPVRMVVGLPLVLQQQDKHEIRKHNLRFSSLTATTTIIPSFPIFLPQILETEFIANSFYTG